jgi:acyl carrier protein
MNDLFRLLQLTKPSITEPPPADADWKSIGLDSLDLAELAARIEKQYRIEISNEDWKQLGNVGEIQAYLERRFKPHD